ncbi:MAG TPA: squalene synthase HpnC [Tepidisphaeraceae bacterium]|nr:squalene synthase HpnC [Tepidisphaeraceae bacterium]
METLVPSSMIPSASPGPERSVPETVRAAFAPAGTLEAARGYTRRLALGHYENFSVVSLLLPKSLRQDFSNVYAFCRTADDLGDEVPDKKLALEYLGRFRDHTRACYEGRYLSPLFLALSETIQKYQIPIGPFLDLIDAFEQDQRVDRYENFDQVVDYCRRSADPVGRLVLYMCGYRDEERQRLSDRTCTALQLANFWQDVRRDIIERDRIYVPKDSMEQFGVTEEQIREGRCDDNYRRLLRFEVDRTEKLFDQGDALLPLLAPEHRRHVMLFSKGGRAVLQSIRRQNYDTLSRRPRLSKFQKGRLMLRAMTATAAAKLTGRSRP